LNYHQILNTLLFNKNIIIKITVSSVILIFLVLIFIYPVSYESTVAVLPPEKESQIGGLSGILTGATDISSIITGGIASANSQLYIEILKSRSAAEYVIKKYHLINLWNSDDLEDAVKSLQKKLNIELTKEGIIRLNVNISTGFFPIFTGEKDSIRKLSSELSNCYIEALDSINRNKLTSKAKKAREYIENQIVKTRYTLDSVETTLMSFQKNNKTISLPDQIKATIESAAKIRGEIASTEIEIGLLEPNLKESNRSLEALKKKLEQLKEQYNKMEVGGEDYFVTFNKAPGIGKNLASLLRDVKIQNEVYLLLEQQYFKEKIQENRDLPTVEILDEAIPPKKSSSPRVFYSSILGGIFIFLTISFMIVILEQKKIKKTTK
jgi:tyrosine-protein kinase Etk/Wzc